MQRPCWKVYKIANIAREVADPKRLAYSHRLKDLAHTTLSERSIYSIMKTTLICFKFAHELQALIKINYNRIISWKISVWVWKTKARLSNQNNKILKCYNFSHTTMTAASICFKSVSLALVYFAEIQYSSINLFEKKSVSSFKNESDLQLSGWQSSERSIFSITKKTPICFKFTHERHNTIFCWIQV